MHLVEPSVWNTVSDESLNGFQGFGFPITFFWLKSDEFQRCSEGSNVLPERERFKKLRKRLLRSRELWLNGKKGHKWPGTSLWVQKSLVYILIFSESKDLQNHMGVTYVRGFICYGGHTSGMSKGQLESWTFGGKLYDPLSLSMVICMELDWKLI